MDTPQRQPNIEALISMLDEKDVELYQSITRAIFRLGEEAVPYLERARQQHDSPLWTNRIDGLLQELHVETACTKLENWKNEKEPDLLKGFYLLSSAFYPGFDWETARDEFNRMHGDCWLLLAGLDDLQKSIVLFNNFFFNHCKFSIGTRITAAYDFSDYFLPRIVLEKKGNERSLALVYQYLAHRNKLPVFLLNLPVVNLLACTTDLALNRKDDIRFCIDISHRGALIRREDLEPVFSRQKQIRICNTIEALQDYIRLLYVMTQQNESNPFRKQAIKKIHQKIGNPPLSMDSFDLNGTPDENEEDF